MNPLAKPLMDLLTAVWDDPKYKAARDAAFEAHTLHAGGILGALKTGERLAPILMMAAVQGLTAEDYEALEKAIQPKLEPLRMARKQEELRALYELKVQLYAEQVKRLETAALAAPATCPPESKWKWTNKL